MTGTGASNSGQLSGARSRQTAHEFVRETLRNAILRGELAGGSRLVQADIAETLDVSTTPVREALRDLASEGLIRLDAHRGGVVHELTTDELIEIYDIRLILEPAAIRRAVERITEAQIDRIDKIHQKMVEDPDYAEFVDYNREFHMSIYDAAGSPRLVSILQGLLDASVMYVSAAVHQMPELRDRAFHDHTAILAAIRERDTEQAAQAIADHIGIPKVVFEASE